MATRSGKRHGGLVVPIILHSGLAAVFENSSVILRRKGGISEGQHLVGLRGGVPGGWCWWPIPGMGIVPILTAFTESGCNFRILRVKLQNAIKQFIVINDIHRIKPMSCPQV